MIGSSYRWLRQNQHIRYMWIPYTDTVVVVSNNRHDQSTGGVLKWLSTWLSGVSSQSANPPVPDDVSPCSWRFSSKKWHVPDALTLAESTDSVHDISAHNLNLRYVFCSLMTATFCLKFAPAGKAVFNAHPPPGNYVTHFLLRATRVK
jgi:hypothetical protein